MTDNIEVHELNEYLRGWFIGNFSPAVLKTKDFEVGILTHKKGEFWQGHYHHFSDEYNLLIEGQMTINGKLIRRNQIFVIKKKIVASPQFLEDCKILVVKVPSIPGDKVNV